MAEDDGCDYSSKHRVVSMNKTPFTESIEGILDSGVLETLGMIENIINMEPRDFLLFYQLILTICDNYRSVIECDLLISYYSKAKKWYNLYVIEIMIGGSYGYD